MPPATIHAHKRIEVGGPTLPVGPVKLGERDGRREGDGETCSHLRCCRSGSEEQSEPVQIMLKTISLLLERYNFETPIESRLQVCDLLLLFYSSVVFYLYRYRVSFYSL